MLDKNGMSLSDNEIGEVYISGESVAIGYHNEKKQGYFLDDPYNPGKRMYKSGDLAYRNDKGFLVYCGRMDDMVKLNGHRVRLGEIEQKILSSGLVDSAAVKVTNRNGGVWICAYVVTGSGKLQRYLTRYTSSRELPEFMVPKQVMQIPQVPLNKNGKVDRARLPDPPVQINKRC
ncbi:MAG: AMP-binding enzyme [Clostridia bacterium]